MKRHLLDADDGVIFLLGEVHFVDTKLWMVIPPPNNPYQSCSALSALGYLAKNIDLGI